MTSRRTARIAEAIRETVSTAILFQLRDPRIQNVTVTQVEVAPDVRTAKVYVSIMGDEKTQKRCLHGLNSARGLLQGKIGDRLQTRYTPVLTFVLDHGVKRSIEVSRLLREALPVGPAPEADPGDADADDDDGDEADVGPAADAAGDIDAADDVADGDETNVDPAPRTATTDSE